MKLLLDVPTLATAIDLPHAPVAAGVGIFLLGLLTLLLLRRIYISRDDE